MKKQEELIFALDIGTRTVIGLVMELRENRYEILASEVVEHENRAMLDGQIHNVTEVVKQVNKVKAKLEERLERKLSRVAIAAAGRALKTNVSNYSTDFESNKIISAEDVQTLEFAAIQQAQQQLARENPGHNPGDYHFVGYSVIEYQLDGIFLGSLVGQRGRTIKVELVATFLPRIVIDSLLAVIDQVGLEVDHLTLEPIAASSVVIPKEMYNFNLALVDIGAGTTDVAITKSGAMIGYAMVPVAGDEITEALAEHYLLDYESSEEVKRTLSEKQSIKVKNILGIETEIGREGALNVIYPQVQKLAGLIAQEILKINQKSPQVVIFVGGGSLTPFLKEELAGQLELPSDRVAIRDSGDVKNISGRIEGVNSVQTLTPMGIAVTSQQSQKKAVFTNIEVNGYQVQLFTLNQPLVSDALLAAEIDIKKLQGRPGMGLTCTVNGELNTIRGSLGEPGYVLANGQPAELEGQLSPGDVLVFEPGKTGKDAVAVIADLIPTSKLAAREITVNGTSLKLETLIYQDDRLVELDTPVRDGAEIKYTRLETIRDAVAQVLEVSHDFLTNEVLQFTLNGRSREIPRGDYLIKENGQLVDLDQPLKDGIDLEVIRIKNKGLKVREVLQVKESEEISFSFNGSDLTMPANRWSVLCNGKEVGLDYEIKDGDVLVHQVEAVTVNQVLKFINYNISPTMKEGLILTINGEAADFTDLVTDGDQIRVDLRV